jgi:hypothetical protein
MGAVTYPDQQVSEFINTNLIPIQLLSNAKPYADDFNIQWTPAIIVLDENGKEHFRTIGFLPPEEFIPAVRFGIPKIHFDHKQYREAIDGADKLIKDYPNSRIVPETIYWQGVARFEETNDPQYLKAIYKKLQADYPSSEWTQRAEPYNLLP